MTKLRDAARYVLEHQAALALSVVTAILTVIIGKLGLDLDASALGLAVITQLSAGLGISRAVYSKATATNIAENAYVAGVLTPVPAPAERIIVPEEVKP